MSSSSKHRNFNKFIDRDFPWKLAALFILMCCSLLHGESTISIIDAKQSLGTKLVEVTYVVTDPGFGTVTVALQASSDGGTTWTVPVISVTGDVGTVPLVSAPPLPSTGTTKKITWNAGKDWPQSYTSQMWFRIIVDDGFSLIPAGNFTMGPWIPGSPISIGGRFNFSGNLYQDWVVVPQSFTAMVSSFYLQEKETTKAQWDEVRSWGMDNGYTDLPTGGGKAANHPVHSVGWSDVVKWCNARSEKEGLTPVYTVSGAVMRTGGAHPVANWTANGYRLPTEAEWEKAAGGGVAEKRFPWGTDTISHEQANYYGYSGGDFRDPVTEYDLSPINNYHPNFNDGVLPYTSPIGSFQANRYGLYDMAGNVREWCWDWFSFQYDTTTTIDPRGPAIPNDSFNGYKVTRGGSWYDKARRVRVADRNASNNQDMGFGFRPARSSISGPRVAELPTVTTPTANSITKTSATIGGKVISDGGATIKERGVVYSTTATNNDPVIKGTGVTKVVAAGTTGIFTVPITGLTQRTGYSYKAYAINSLGVPSYTDVAAFTTEFDFVLINGGVYPRGVNEYILSSGMTVNISSFYLQEKETTKAQWDEVRSWGMDNGYTDLPTGGGKAANHPVDSVNWFDVVKWCNARSEKEGLTPVYTANGAVMRTGTMEPVANWTSKGYRLPTEAEWESAAWGNPWDGSCYRFGCGTNTISHEYANFNNGFAYPNYATGTTGYHPIYNDGVVPYTSPVGSFRANGNGLYDMAGNVGEWCWDWYDVSYYTQNNGKTDPRGPAFSSDGYRVTRGGSWGSGSQACYSASRGMTSPNIAPPPQLPWPQYRYSFGLRPARSIF